MKNVFDRSWATLYSWNKNRHAAIYDEYAGRMAENPAFVEEGNTVDTATRYGLTVREWNPGRGKIFRIRLDRPWAHPAFCTMGTGPFPRVKRLERGVDHPATSSAEVKGRVELYLYSSFGPSWPVLGRTLPLLYVIPFPSVNSLN